jgi:hypothetical protein
LKNKSSETEDPLILVDHIFSRLEYLEDNLYKLFGESDKHRGAHVNVQTALDDIYDMLRELRRIIYGNKC